MTAPTASCASTTGHHGSGSSASCGSGPTGWCGTIPDRDAHRVTSAPDVVVVGGGLVGAASAYEFARDGHRVVVVDRHDAGRATDAGAGILSPETMGGMPAPFLDLADLAGAHYRSP